MSTTDDPTPADQIAYARAQKRERRAQRVAAGAFMVSIAAAIGLLAVYVVAGNTQLQGVLLFVGFAGVGVGLGVWVKVIVGPQEVVEERYPMRSPDEERAAFETEYRESLGEAVVGGRRRFLLRLLGAAGGSLGLALLIPLRSLGPGPKNALFTTGWAKGRRVVNTDGKALKPEDVVADQAITVFPEGHVGSADSQAILIGLRPGKKVDLVEPTVDGMVVYSKICTHAGCPVGLYRAAAGQLLCPCHQSTFDVYDHAAVVSGPAGHPLPQLPINVNADGELVARGPFSEPVGPTFWNMYRGDRGPESASAKGDA